MVVSKSGKIDFFANFGNRASGLTFARLDILQTQLQVGSAVIGILFNVVTGIERFAIVYIHHVLCHTKTNAIDGPAWTNNLDFQVFVFQNS